MIIKMAGNRSERTEIIVKPDGGNLLKVINNVSE
jgi:hypothetical protein